MARIDLNVNKGCNFMCEYEASHEEDNTSINCELYDFYMQVRKTNQFGDCVLRASTKNGKIRTKENTFTLVLEPEDTTELKTTNDYVYDMKGIEKETGTVVLFVDGGFILKPEITKMSEMSNDGN